MVLTSPWASAYIYLYPLPSPFPAVPLPSPQRGGKVWSSHTGKPSPTAETRSLGRANIFKVQSKFCPYISSILFGTANEEIVKKKKKVWAGRQGRADMPPALREWSCSPLPRGLCGWAGQAWVHLYGRDEGMNPQGTFSERPKEAATTTGRCYEEKVSERHTSLGHLVRRDKILEYPQFN